MQKDSGQSDHSIRRKSPKCGENWPFWAILDVFSGWPLGQKMAIFKSLQRKRQKCPKMANFHPILEVFSGLNNQIDLNPFASCQASSGTSSEYPHWVFWRYLKFANFCPSGHRAKSWKFKMATTGPKMVKIFQNYRILNSHTCVPQLTYKIVKSWFFCIKRSILSIFGHFETFWPFLPPFSHRITLKLKFFAEYQIHTHLSLKGWFLSSANKVSTGPTCQFLCVCVSVCLSFRSFFQGV